jgi:carbon-monoxide dehydrogenase small subunit
MSNVQIRLKVNGEGVSAVVEPRLTLADFLRQHLELTGTHVGCEHGVCGACTILLNDDIVRGCCVLAVQAADSEVVTIEGLVDDPRMAALREAFHSRNALQCGFCTPAMLVTARALLQQNPQPTRDEIRDFLSGNYCRCTGYHAIVDAIETVSRQPAGAQP